MNNTKNFQQTMMERISVEQAITCMVSAVKPIKDTETISILQANGRILSETIIASFDNPPFDRSAVDGYVCHFEDIQEATKDIPVALTVLEEIDAGQYSSTIVPRGCAVRIMTGAPIPAGCDCCLRQEDTDYGEKTVLVYRSLKRFDNYCFQGEDFKKETTMLQAGQKLSYVEIGILASLGYATVSVIRKPKIALFTTGDEVVLPGTPLQNGKIYNSNLFFLQARLQDFNFELCDTGIVPDEPSKLAECFQQLSTKVDLIITTGGVSVGKKDIVHDAVKLCGAKKIFWRVLLKPGTPTIFSILNNTPIVSLTGNPFGALANFELLIRPMLAVMTSDSHLNNKRITAIMKDQFPKASKNRRFIRGTYCDGTVTLPKGLHSSGVFSSMAGCNCMIDIPAGTEALHSGDTVSIVLI